MKSDTLQDWSISDVECGKIAVPLTPNTLGVVVEGGYIFKRNAIKDALTPNAEHIRCLVAELDGVRIYIRGDKILMTKRNVRL